MRYFFSFGSLFLPTLLFAIIASADEPVLVEKPVEEKKNFFGRLFSRLEDDRAGMSEFLVDKSNEIDLLFANPNYLATRNTTNLRLSNYGLYGEDDGYSNDFNLSFKLKLPRSQDKLQFQFDQAVDDLTTGDGSQQLNQNFSQQQQNSRGRAGLNYYQSVLSTDVRLTAGVRVKDQLVPWTNAKFRNYLLRTKNDRHLLELIQDYYGESLEGLEHKGYLAYTFKISDIYIFRFSNESLYRDFDNSFQIIQGVSIFQNVDHGHSIAYTVSALSKNPAAEDVYYLDSYNVGIGYRRRMYKRHYYITVRPGATIPKEKSWEVLPNIQVGIDIFFGNP